MNILKERIKKGEKLCGTLVSLTDPCLCEIMGTVGFDYVWIDMEHTYISCKDTLCHLNAARSAGVASIVRVPQNDLTVTKKILEMGPEGIIFPMMRTADEIRDMIAATLYPPIGTRGFGPMRAIRYGATDMTEYTESESLDTCRFIQIEHIDCIENLEEIVKIPYIDGFIFGPNDLSGSIGELGRVFDTNTTEQILKALKILKSSGKYVGLATGDMRPQTITYWSDLGIDMLTVGADWNFVYEKAKQTSEDMNRYHKEKIK